MLKNVSERGNHGWTRNRFGTALCQRTERPSQTIRIAVTTQVTRWLGTILAARRRQNLRIGSPGLAISVYVVFMATPRSRLDRENYHNGAEAATAAQRQA